MNQELAVRGDIIEWELDFDFIDCPKGHKFQAEVASIDWAEGDYLVYAEYGQDRIPFNECKIIKRQ